VTNLLVLQAYGRPQIVQEARFCILTFQHWALRSPDRYRIIVYTDQPGAFRGLGPNVVTEILSPETLARWRGAIDFVHRIKLELLLHCAARYDGILLYVDSDTHFLRDPVSIYAATDRGTAFMHECEGRLVERKNGIFRKMHRFVRDHVFTLPDGETVRMPVETEMWNAGVIALHPENTALLHRALSLTDAMYVLYPKHVIEQLAVSYELQRSLVLRAANDVIYHYWRFCDEFEHRLAAFFGAHDASDVRVAAAAAVALSPRGTLIPRRPWYRRILG